jgi:hypothetical protein
MQNKLEIKMGLKTLSSLELLVKGIRNVGPFGGPSIDSFSLGNLLKKAEEQAEQSLRTIKSLEHFPNTCRVTKVWLEDKYEREKKILVEQVIGEVLQLPDNLNGFEFLFHPHLEKEENLITHFKSWHSTTLSSIYYLLGNSAVSTCFLSPVSSEDKEVAHELRKRYNLVVTGQEYEMHNHPDCTKIDPGLEMLSKSRHSINRLLFKIKLATLRSFQPIYEDIKGHPFNYSPSPAPAYSARTHLKSDSLSMDNSFTPSRFSFPAESPNLLRQSSVSDYSGDSLLNMQFGGNNKPFRVQESVLQERLRKLSSNLGTEWTGDDLAAIGGWDNKALQQMAAQDLSLDANSGDKSLTRQSKGSSGELPKMVGLANIGNELLKNGSRPSKEIAFDFEPDEDEKLVNLCSASESASKKLSQIDVVIADRQVPVACGPFTPAKFVMNLTENLNKKFSEYNNLGDWLSDQPNA